ncbi:hypothetical protein [Micromonospora sp. DH13]|uniref:hypothetical protein n=1 Tax=Micromonospora sp. DH13 TaxID=2857013 RepID=UPI001E36912D|nr:hypothetical protein [Micromonospora sp. DH13]
MSEPLPPGSVQFYDGYRPGLDAGTYELSAVQSVDGVDTGAYFGPRTQTFTVDAPRFVLDAGDVGEMYPPANSSGDFGATLPSIVLNRRTLPWERHLGADSSDPAEPWLALLLLRSDELPPGPALHTGTVAQFLDASDPHERPPAIAADKLSAQVLATQMTSLSLHRRLFTAIAPAAGEARLLAHVRRTDTASRAAGQADRDGWHAVVVANRRPAPPPGSGGTGSAHLACLVSLEGHAVDLPGVGGAPADGGDGGDVRLRLAVLASWSFTSNPAGGGDIGRLLAGLAPAVSAGPEALLPRIPVPPSAPPSAALTRLRQGFAALDYRLPTGEQTFAWYRGPFTPYPAQPLPGPTDGTPHYATASEVTVYSQSDGVFDVSYAVAFEAGRLAALADRGFAVAMVNARRSAFQIVAKLQARAGSPLFANLRPVLPVPPAPTPPPGPEVSAADLLAVHSRNAFGELLAGGMGDQLTSVLTGPPAPPSPPMVVSPGTAAAAVIAGLLPPPSALYLGGGGFDEGFDAAHLSSAEPVEPAEPPAPPRPSDPDLPTGFIPGRPGWPGRDGLDPVEQLRYLLSRTDVQDLLADHARGPAADPATGWLAELALLHRIPFRHLIPDERMLPVESMRFFYLDSGWIAALIDGALSIGVEGSRDLELHQAMSRPLVEIVAAKVGAVRADHRNRPDLAVPTGGAEAAGTGASTAAGLATPPTPPTPTTPQGPPGSGGLPDIPGRPDRPDPGPDAIPLPQQRTGLLLRSAVVAGWPGLAVEASAGGRPVPLLRLDRLSDTVLLALFDSVPDTVTLTEPWHGLHFGFSDGGGEAGGGEGSGEGGGGGLVLRRPDGTELNARFPAAGQPGLHAAFTRPGDPSVLRVHDLADALQARLAELLPGTEVPMGPALFATELLASAHQLTLHHTAPAPRET